MPRLAEPHARPCGVMIYCCFGTTDGFTEKDEEEFIEKFINPLQLGLFEEMWVIDGVILSFKNPEGYSIEKIASDCDDAIKKYIGGGE